MRAAMREEVSRMPRKTSTEREAEKTSSVKQQPRHSEREKRSESRRDRHGAAVHGCGLCGGGTFTGCEREQTEKKQ